MPLNPFDGYRFQVKHTDQQATLINYAPVDSEEDSEDSDSEFDPPTAVGFDYNPDAADGGEAPGRVVVIEFGQTHVLQLDITAHVDELAQPADLWQ